MDSLQLATDQDHTNPNFYQNKVCSTICHKKVFGQKLKFFDIFELAFFPWKVP